MDWIRFLDENHVGYVTRGPNTKRGEVSIKCPMCGEEDPSEHLGINLETENWGCHRNSSHRGKSARTLIKAILGCSSQQAGFVVRQYSKADPDNLESALSTLMFDDCQENLNKKITNQKNEPKFSDFNQIKARGVTKRFFKYLQGRGYDNPYEIIGAYNLRCCLTGKYKDRIIIPITLNGELLGWTSRALGSPVEAPRYLASNVEVKTTIFNYDKLKNGGKRLFVVEGPFDAIKMDNFGYRNNETIRATCTFGTSVTISQIALLRTLAKRFEEVFVLFDKGAEDQGENLASWVDAKSAYLPNDVDDPGELVDHDLKWMLNKNYNGYSVRVSDLVRASIKYRTNDLAKVLTQSSVLLKYLSRKR
jgi:5S rRNA maturation endonuclease (ribonuclease M5)